MTSSTISPPILYSTAHDPNEPFAVPIGLDDWNEPVHEWLWHEEHGAHHQLVLHRPGCGASNLLRVVARAADHTNLMRVWAVDTTGARIADPQAPGVEHVATDFEDAAWMLDSLHWALNARRRRLRTDVLELTADTPLWVLLVDQLRVLTRNKRTWLTFERLVDLGHNLGLVVVGADTSILNAGPNLANNGQVLMLRRTDEPGVAEHRQPVTLDRISLNTVRVFHLPAST